MVGKAEIMVIDCWRFPQCGELVTSGSLNEHCVCPCRGWPSAQRSAAMRDVKDTARAVVRISYDGRVFKTFRGPKAEERFENEVKVLRHLEARGCTFVPRLLEVDPAQLRIVTSNCGSRV